MKGITVLRGMGSLRLNHSKKKKKKKQTKDLLLLLYFFDDNNNNMVVSFGRTTYLKRRCTRIKSGGPKTILTIFPGVISIILSPSIFLIQDPSFFGTGIDKATYFFSSRNVDVVASLLNLLLGVLSFSNLQLFQNFISKNSSC
jgi:hypothetical protein